MCFENSQMADMWYAIEVTVYYIIALLMRNHSYFFYHNPTSVVVSIMFTLMLYHVILLLCTLPQSKFKEEIHKSLWFVKIPLVMYCILLFLSLTDEVLSKLNKPLFWMGTLFLFFQTLLLVYSAIMIHRFISLVGDQYRSTSWVIMGLIFISVFFNVGVLIFFAIIDGNMGQDDWKSYLVMANLIIFFITLAYSVSERVLKASMYSGMLIPAYLGLYNAFQVFSMVRNYDGAGCEDRANTPMDSFLNYTSTSFTVLSMFLSGAFHGQDPQKYWAIHFIYIFLCAYCDQTLVNWDADRMQYICIDVGYNAMYVKLFCLISSYALYYLITKIKKTDQDPNNLEFVL